MESDKISYQIKDEEYTNYAKTRQIEELGMFRFYGMICRNISYSTNAFYRQET